MSNCKKIVFGLILILAVLVLIHIKLLLENKKLGQNLVGIQKNLSELKKTKPGEVFYRDKYNLFSIRIPYGWEIVRTEYWDSINIIGSDRGIMANYYDHNRMQKNLLILKEYYRNNNEPLLTVVKRIVDSQQLTKKDYARPIIKEYTYAGRVAVLVNCEHMTIKGAGGYCSKTGYDDSSDGDPFLRNIYIDDNKGGYIRLDINGYRNDQSYKVDLTQWIDRVSFFP
jgi:hypothetical protein